jgi:ABC-2 type transport system permease protein
VNVSDGVLGPAPRRGLLNRGPLLLAFIRRDWKIAISYKLAFATQVIQSVVTLAFLYFLGHLVDTTRAIHLGGSASLRLGYFPFAVLGVALLGVVSTELRTVSGQIRSDQTTGTLEALLSMPPPPSVTVACGVAFQLLYSAIIAVATVLIAVVFFGMRFHATLASGLFALAGLAVSFPLFVSLGVAFASAVVVFKRGGTFFGFVVTGFSLFGGVYYPTSTLSRPLQLVAHVLPFTWALDVIRGGLLEARPRWGELGLLVGVSAVLVPLSLRVFTAAVAHARRRGTLGQY